VIPRKPTGAGALPPVASTPLTCTATYYEHLSNQYAFVFQVPSTLTRFTILGPNADSYEISQRYALIVSAPDAVPVPLSVDDVEFLHHCLTNAEQRWHQAITEADPAAERPQSERKPQSGYLNIEPTPAGYRAAGTLFRDELERVRQLNARLGQVHEAAACENGD